MSNHNWNLPFAPIGLETFYGLDRACQLLFSGMVRMVDKRVRVFSSNVDWVMLAARRLYWVDELIVDTPQIAESVFTLPYVTVSVVDSTRNVDGGLLLFDRTRYADNLPQVPYLVVFCDNRLSYKTLLYRKQVYDNSVQLRRWFSAGYSIDTSLGLFGLKFLLHWTLSNAFANRSSVVHFREQQHALDAIYDTSIFKHLAYLQILAGALQ